MANANSPIATMDFSDAKWIHGSAQVANGISEGVPGTAMLPLKSLHNPKEIRTYRPTASLRQEPEGKGAAPSQN